MVSKPEGFSCLGPQALLKWMPCVEVASALEGLEDQECHKSQLVTAFNLRGIQTWQ